MLASGRAVTPWTSRRSGERRYRLGCAHRAAPCIRPCRFLSSSHISRAHRCRRLCKRHREPGDQARRDALHFFSREPVFLIPSGSDRSPGSQEIGLAGMHRTFFKGTSFPHSFRLGPQPWKPGDRARRDALHFFSREPVFLIPFVSRTPLAAPDFSPVVLPLALRRKEIAEFWQYGKRARRCSDSFRQHPDTVLAKVA